MSGVVAFLRTIAIRCCQPHTLQRVVDPLLADFQAEHDASQRCDGRWQRVCFWTFAALTLARAVVAYEGLGAIAWLASVARGDQPDATRLARQWFAALLVCVAALIALPAASVALSGAPLSLRAAALLLPQALPYGLAAALTIAVLLSGQAMARPALRRLVMAAALAASIASFALAAWTVPVTNQMFRIEVAGRALPPGPAELSLPELHRRLAPARDVPWRALPVADREYLVSLHARWAVPASCVLLSWAAMLLGLRTRLGPATRAGIGVATVTTYLAAAMALQVAGQGGHLHPALAVWLPNLGVLSMMPVLTHIPRRATIS